MAVAPRPRLLLTLQMAVPPEDRHIATWELRSDAAIGEDGVTPLSVSRAVEVLNIYLAQEPESIP